MIKNLRAAHKLVILLLALNSLSGCHEAAVLVEKRPSNWAEKLSNTGLYNLYKVDEHLYRSEQPDAAEMKQLYDIGIKTILNVRNLRNDNRECKTTELNAVHFPINTWTISYEEVVEAMQQIERAQKPVLIHCKHGSDRTGCIVAAYRMVHCGWTKEEAIKEFKDGGYGYHAKWFPNILRLLEAIDIPTLKTDITKEE